MSISVPAGPANLGVAVGEVLVPVGFAEGVLEQLVFVGFGGLVASVGELAAFEVVAGDEAFDVGHDDDVGELAVAGFVVFDTDGEGALQDAEDGVEVALADGLEREADGEDDVGVHGFEVGGGKVLEDGAVDEQYAE